VLSMLGLPAPAAFARATIAEVWDWAIGKWDVGLVPKRLNLRVND